MPDPYCQRMVPAADIVTHSPGEKNEADEKNEAEEMLAAARDEWLRKN